jgi:penicillin amidase
MRASLRYAAAVATLAMVEAASAAPEPVRRQVAGLTGQASIVIDRWGVAHIYAKTRRDAFFLQGYNAARDRLWQIDLWRKRGLGRLAENFGPAYVEQDRAARLLLYRGDMSAEWAAYPADAKGMTEAFVAGINAYVEEVLAGAQPMPVEFGLTDTRPDRWQIADAVRIRSHALVSNILAEVMRARVACGGGLDATALMWKLEPAHTVKLPEGLDPCSVPLSVLQTYQLGVGAVAFQPPAPDDPARKPGSEGSNGWVVAPERTATGRAMLANDPHRALGVPSLRYVVHLDAPGLSVIGAGEPALPGISFGHNGRIAWGLTILNTDQEDLQVYDLRPGDPQSYRYGQGWEKIRTVEETIAVRGEPSRTVALRFTRHGPVLALDEKAGKAFALRSVWSEPGTAGYFASAWMLGARNWAEFRRGQRHWGTPPLNLIYADSRGNIGWTAAAKLPVRRNWDGLLPVPGDGRYEWRGFHPGTALPSRYNPPEGWIATANEMNLPVDYPAEARNLGFEWAERSRFERIAEVLSAKSAVTIDDMLALQVDSHDVMARRLLALIRPLSASDPRGKAALALLNTWDANESTDSAAAALYQMWVTRFLGTAVIAAQAPPQVRPLLGAGSLDVIISRLEAPDAALRDMRDRILVETLSAAYAALEVRLGTDAAAWFWGALHQATVIPAVAPLADPALRARMTVGPVAVPGSGSTPIALSFRGTDFTPTSGASVRIAIDVGDWDRSRFINMPGQSGDSSSPHYRDLFPLWADGRAVPLLFSRPAVMREADTILALSPR